MTYYRIIQLSFFGVTFVYGTYECCLWRGRSGFYRRRGVNGKLLKYAKNTSVASGKRLRQIVARTTRVPKSITGKPSDRQRYIIEGVRLSLRVMGC
jgi:hypothetical protein